MKKNTKILIVCLAIVLIAAIIIVVLLTNKKYTDDCTSNELYELVSDSFLTDGGIKILEDDVILEFAEEKPSYLIDYVVIKAKNAKNINEIGIFKVEKGNDRKMKSEVEEYVANLQKTYRAMDYFPEEVEKIDCATVKVFGNYVVYSFLNENDTEAFYSAIEKELKK